MKKLLYTFLAVSIIFSACIKEEEDETGTVTLRVTCATVPFNVTYDNEYGNDITEISNINEWEKQFIRTCEGSCSEYTQWLNIDVGPPQWGNDTPAYSTLAISFKGNLLMSYEGVTEYETIYCDLD